MVSVKRDVSRDVSDKKKMEAPSHCAGFKPKRLSQDRLIYRMGVKPSEHCHTESVASETKTKQR